MSILLFLLTVGVTHARHLNLHESLKREKQPVKITADRQSHSRSKRSWGDDDHDSSDPSDIAVDFKKLAPDSHTVAFVEWGGTDKGSQTILVLTRDSNSPPSESTLYVSTDYGASYNQKSLVYGGKKVICTYIYQSLSDHTEFLLNDVVNKLVVVSKDEGETWNIVKVDFTPSILSHHPSKKGLVLAYDQIAYSLYLTKDSGSTWTQLRQGKTIASASWSQSKFDTEDTMFVTEKNGDGTLSVWSSSDLFASTPISLGSNVLEFEHVDDFYFLVKKSTHTDHGDNDRDLFISYDRGGHFKAKFPPETANNPTTEFYIADAGEGQVFVAVSHADNMTHLYVSEHKGHNMVLSLERVLFTNAASFEQVSWLRGSEPFTDFQAIEGLPGVFIASQLDAGQVGHRRIHTVMTYNKGGTWQRVQPPTLDMYNYPTECYLPECSLHISLIFGVKLPYAQHTPLLTKANAPGFIIASGNIGGSHSTRNDVFMSNDGGVEWFQIFEDQYFYQFADHGGIAVAVPRRSTNHIMYSHDEGLTWFNKTVSDDLIVAQGLITEPGEITTVFNIYATYPNTMGWIIITLDFKKALGPPCTSYDFMKWSIRDELKNTECVLGKDTMYERKKGSSHCYIGKDYKREISDKSCPCQASDFECDFLYQREYPGDPCMLVMNVDEKWFIPEKCDPGERYNRSSGYIKIEGDLCSGGEEQIFAPKEVPCPDTAIKNLAVTVTPKRSVAVNTPITVKAVSDSYLGDVYFMWYTDDNKTASGHGISGSSATFTFAYSGTYTVTVTASNGAGPVVAMTTINVDEPLSGLELSVTPDDPSVGEMVFIVVSAGDFSFNFDFRRLTFTWTPGTTTHLPLLMHTFTEPGVQTVKCHVNNSISFLDIEQTFTVIDLKVTEINAIAVDNTHIQVYWQAPVQRPGLIDSYVIKYHSVESTSWTRFSYNGTLTTYRLGPLKANTQYQLTVLSSSKNGKTSDVAKTVTAGTLPTNTKDPVTDLSGTVDGQQITLTWTGNGATSYTVEYWPTDRYDVVLSVSTPQTTLTIKDLRAGASYAFRVKAEFDDNKAAVSYSVALDKTTEGQTPDAVENLRGMSTNSTSIALTWDLPAKAVDGFRVRNGTTSEILNTVTVTKYAQSGLLPDTNYHFTVEPFYGQRSGGISSIVTVKTDFGVPDPVRDLSCLLNKNGVAVLKWSPPARSNGPMQAYLIDHSDETLTGIQRTVPSTQRSLTLPELTEYHEYTFSVRARNSIYNSSAVYTECIVESTPGIPGPVINLYAKSVTLNTALLTWDAPLYTGPLDITYVVNFGVTKGGSMLGVYHTFKTNSTDYLLRNYLTPSTQYAVTVTATNTKGSGPASATIVLNTLTLETGGVEYEIKFPAAHFKEETQNWDSFTNSVKAEIELLTQVSQSRLVAIGLVGQPSTYVTLAVWITPRPTSSPISPSSEEVVAILDREIKAGNFVVGKMRATDGKVNQTTQPVISSSHHDVAEIVIPGICGLLVVGLVAGLLYYRNKYQQVLRRARFTSRFNNTGDEGDVNMIECADDAAPSTDLRGGALAISSDGVNHSQPPTSLKNILGRLTGRSAASNQYSRLASGEDEELLDDDEDHLLPL